MTALAAKRITKCFKCKKPGHFKKDCPRNNYEKAPQKMNFRHNKDKDYALLTALSVKVENNSWYIDSGATNHMCNNKEIMSELVMDKSLDVSVANGEKLFTGGRGVVRVSLRDSVKTISNVFYVPNLSANLLSVSELARKGYTVTFDSKCCKICDGSTIIATASYVNGTYQLDTSENVNKSCMESEVAMGSSCVESSACGESSPTEECSTADQLCRYTAGVSADKMESQEVWHKRLGHLNSRSMSLMKNGMVTGMNYSNTNYKNCVACVEEKQNKLPFAKNSMSRSKELLGLVHTDLCGPMEEPSFSGTRYFVTFIDDFSRKTYIYFLRTKDEVFDKFKEFKALVENETNNKIKIIRSDNGGEFINHAFQEYMKSCGIRHQTTVPHCSEQNGVAERANRTIMEKARCMLQEAGLSKKYWAEAVNTAVYLKNRSPTKAVMGLVPEEKWSSKKVNVSHLRIFGCDAYALNENRKKLDPKSKRFIFVGYCEESKGYRLLDPLSPKKCIKARHVTFFENKFCKNVMSHDDNEGNIVFLPSESLQKDCNDSTESDDMRVMSPESSETCQTPINDPRRETIFSLNESSVTEDSWDDTYVPGSSDINSEDTEFEDSSEMAQLAGMMTKDTDVPETVQEALDSSEGEQWRAAMTDEYNSFLSNQCWTLVDLPAGQKCVKCKWVFTKKKGPNGELLKYKARLVAKGYTQKYGIDYK